MLSRLRIGLAAALLVALLVNGNQGAGFLRPASVFAQVNQTTYSLIEEAALLVLKGNVELQRGGGPFTQVTADTEVQVGDRIRTGPESFAVVTYFDGSTTTLEPNSEIQLGRLDKLPGGGAGISFLQAVGTSWNRVGRLLGGQSRFETTTATSTAFVRGTEYKVSVDPSQVTSIEASTDSVSVEAVVEGEVVAETVEPGFQTSVDPGQPPTPPEAIPPAPFAFLLEVDGAVSFFLTDEDQRSVGFHPEADAFANQITSAKYSVAEGHQTLSLPNPVSSYDLTFKAQGEGGAYRATVSGLQRGIPIEGVPIASRGGGLARPLLQVRQFEGVLGPGEGFDQTNLQFQPATGPQLAETVTRVTAPPAIGRVAFVQRQVAVNEALTTLQEGKVLPSPTPAATAMPAATPLPTQNVPTPAPVPTEAPVRAGGGGGGGGGGAVAPVAPAPTGTATPTAAAEKVYGQPDFVSSGNGTTASTMDNPRGAAVDGSGNLYVVENGSNRVLFFPSGSVSGAAATKVFGQSNFTSTGAGTTASTMDNPRGIAVDGSGNLYVADNGNNRVLFFPSGSVSGAAATQVFGQPNFTSSGAGTTASTMSGPVGVAVDGSGNLYVADSVNNRVLFFPSGSVSGAAATKVFGQSNFTSSGAGATASTMNFPTGVAVDGSGNLYVVDNGSNRVLFFPSGSVSGAAATKVFGQSNFTSSGAGTTASTMRLPYGVALDGSGNLYVADRANSRVLFFPSGSASGAAATKVFGQPNFTSSGVGTTASTMDNPRGVAVDGSGNLYVGDSLSNRVLFFPNGSASGAAATKVFGQLDFVSSGNGTTASTMNFPTGLAVDGSGNLYVADEVNNRVLLLPSGSASGAAATKVFGQSNFTSSGAGTTASTINDPNGVAVDGSGNLYVAESVNNRVLFFPSGSVSGAAATKVFGQSDFTSSGVGTTASTMNFPNRLAVDGSGNLYVADAGNNRVLFFPAVSSTLATNFAATKVFGQSNFTSSGLGTTASTMNQPKGLAVDGSGNLYVADAGNNRVLFFPAVSSTLATNFAATKVFGQSNFTSSGAGTTASTMTFPTGAAVDGSGNLYVAESVNNRVLFFPSGSANGAAATKVFGQLDFTSSGAGTTASTMNNPRGVAVDGSGNLYVADSSNNRVLVNPPAAATAPGAPTGVAAMGNAQATVSDLHLQHRRRDGDADSRRDGDQRHGNPADQRGDLHLHRDRDQRRRYERALSCLERI